MTDNEGKPIGAMRVVRPGWVEVGGARMSLLEIKGGFQSFKEVIHQAVGAEASDLVFEFGLRAAIEFMTHALGRGSVSPDASGFRAALRIYTDAGFGHYQARDLDYGRGFAVVEAEDAFEGWAARELHPERGAPCCDYSRGVLLGMLAETLRSRDPETAQRLCCVETACIAARGADRCVFVLGRREDLEAMGHRPPASPPASAQEIGRRLTEARERERLYRDLIEDVIDGVYVLDGEGRISFANRGASAHLERPNSEIVGRHYAEFVHPDDWASLAEVFVDLLGGRRKSVERFEGRLVTPSGDLKPFEFNARGVYDDAGRCLRIEGVGRDLSARRRLEQRLLAAERFAAVGRVAAQLAHEINNPLATIKTSLAVVQRQGLEGHGRECLRVAADEIDRIAGIVRRLLDFYGPESPGESRAGAASVIRDLAQILRPRFEGRAMRLEVFLEEPLPDAAISPRALKQVLLNLLNNAFEAMRDGDAAWVRARPEGAELVLEVEDAGPGIAAEAMARLFEPFYTTKADAGGTGLGLSILHGLVTGAGGSVEVRTGEAGGARFIVRLPRAEEAPAGDAPARP